MSDLDNALQALRAADAAGNTEDATKLAQIVDRLSKSQSAPAPVQSPGRLEGAINSFSRNLMTLGSGFANPIEAGMRATGDYLRKQTGNMPTEGMVNPARPEVPADKTWGELYKEHLAQQTGEAKAFAQEHPTLNTAAATTGILASIPALATGQSALMKAAPTAVGRAGQAAAVGGLTGAYGAGTQATDADSLSDAAKSMAKGAAFGAVTGGATSYGLDKLAGAFTRSQANKTIPTVEELGNAADQAYQSARNAGLVVKPNSYADLADDIAATVAREGINPKLHPKATAALEVINDAKGQPLSLDQIDQVRRIVKDAAKSPDEYRLTGIIKNKLDDYLSNLGPNDVHAGDSEAAVSALTTARDLWSRMRKGETIEGLIEKAKNSAPNFSGSGMENALRTQFRSLANNAKQMRFFSDAEQEAIKKVARGGPVENTLRMLGKFAPTGVVSGVLSGGAGAAMLGTPGAVALPALGWGARQAATAMTKGNVDALGNLVRSGGNLPAPQALAPEVQGLLNASGPALSPAMRGLLSDYFGAQIGAPQPRP